MQLLNDEKIMSEMEQKPQSSIEAVNTVEKQQETKKVPGVPFTKDDPRINRNGRPEGALNFATKWRIFIDKVAKQNNITPDEVDEQLLAVAFKQAKEANYPFWQDIHNRVYGKPKETVQIQGVEFLYDEAD